MCVCWCIINPPRPKGQPLQRRGMRGVIIALDVYSLIPLLRMGAKGDVLSEVEVAEWILKLYAR
jgi:hypothetical protein